VTRGPLTRFGPAAALAAILIAGAVALQALLGDDGAGPLREADGRVPGYQATVARALPSVVQIRSGREIGSGVVFDGDGFIVTNAHVVARGDTFQVTTADGSKHTATLRGAYPAGDLAVLEVSGADLEPATFADSSRVEVGELALAIGSPFGLRSSVTEGIVSSTSRTVNEGPGVVLTSVIQTSAPINPGNSGGALVDGTGAVIGIPTLTALNPGMGRAAAPGIGFAIASNTVTAIAGELARTGRVEGAAERSSR
jgi:putative serine protease PepD